MQAGIFSNKQNIPKSKKKANKNKHVAQHLQLILKQTKMLIYK